MKPIDEQLSRLLRAAAAAPQELPDTLPFAVEARVLANWRAMAAQGEPLPLPLLPVFRRGLACACVLMVVALVFGVSQMRQLTRDNWPTSSEMVNLVWMQ
jgi:hypothetical protein